MGKSLATWETNTLNQHIDLDNQSYDCVDVPKSWAEYLTGKPWQQSLCWGNAKDIYGNCPDTYWTHLPKGNVPQPGDIFVMNGTIGGGFGHTGVVVSVDGGNMTVYQQNTFTQQAVYTGVYGWNSSYITGFLRSKIAFDVATALQGWQRTVGEGGVNYRKAASRNGELIELFAQGDVADFGGFVHGENVDGNDVWFVGRYTGGYAWSGGFTDPTTHDLADLTPATTAIGANQRKIAGDVMNYRKAPQVAPDNVIRTYNPGEILTFVGWQHGQSVDGNDVWFKGDTGGFMWSGGLVDSSTHDIPEITSTPTPQPVPDPTPVPPSSDPSIKQVVNKKHPNQPIDYIPTDLVIVGNGQYMRGEAALALLKMQAAQSGLTAASGYRSYAVQKTVYDGYVAKDGQAKADTYSARPGYSEHQTGLAMDFGSIDDTFATTPAHAWLTENAHKYGFVLRYPKDKQAITGYIWESWHWRYVGVTDATAMHDQGITTLEEFYKVPGGLYADQEPTPAPTPSPEPVPNPTPTPQPENPDKNASIEAMKLLGRNGVLGAISAVLTALGNWALLQIAGLHLPQELLVSLGGLVYAGLLFLDKWIHDNAKTKLKGIVGF